jgi:hypothetical protein
MASGKKLKWGKMKVFIAPITAGGIGAYTEVFTPVQGSFALNVEEGDKLEAFIEGGERIAVRQDSSRYSFEFQVYVTNDIPKPILDTDGIITEEYAIRIIPENAQLEGFIMERAAVSVTETFTSEEGHRATYTFEALKPETGAMLKPYTAIAVTPASLSFAKTADTVGQDITVTTTGTVTATSDQSWVTVIVTGSTVKVKVTANDTGSTRVAYITISSGGNNITVVATQAGV